MTLSEFVQSAVRTSFEEDRWYAGLLPSIAGLTAEQAAWKPAPERNSIWQIVRHVTRWKRAVLSAWGGDEPDWAQVEAADWQPVDGGEAAWQADRGELARVTAGLVERWSALSDQELLAPRPGWSGSAIMLAFNLASHDAFHAGQIRLVRRLQGL